MATKFLRAVACAVTSLFVASAAVTSANAASAPSTDTAATKAPQKTVVLVHGFFADGSCWAQVIRILQDSGIRVVAVQNALQSLAGDAEATRRVIDQQPGQVVLVGHSWGGMVITQAGVDPKVDSLVYVAAFAADAGVSVSNLLAPYPPAPWIADVVADDSGGLSLTTAGFVKYFASGLPQGKALELSAVQEPTFAGEQQEPLTQAAWVNKPSWYVKTDDDEIIAPALQGAMSSHIGAHVVDVPSGHLVMVSHPEKVAEVIVEALLHH